MAMAAIGKCEGCDKWVKSEKLRAIPTTGMMLCPECKEEEDIETEYQQSILE